LLIDTIGQNNSGVDFYLQNGRVSIISDSYCSGPQFISWPEVIIYDLFLCLQKIAGMAVQTRTRPLSSIL